MNGLQSSVLLWAPVNLRDNASDHRSEIDAGGFKYYKGGRVLTWPPTLFTFDTPGELKKYDYSLIDLC